jgi:hypothetical protein
MIFSPKIVPKMSAALFTAALLLLLIPGYPVLVLASAVGTVVGVSLLYLIVDTREALRFSWLLSATLLVAYAGGAVSTWFNSISVEDFAYLTKDRPVDLLSVTLAAVFISTGIMMIAGRFEQPILRSSDEMPGDPGMGVFVSLLGLGLIVLAYLTEQLGYEGVQADATTRQIPVLGAIATLIAAPMAGLFGYMFGRFNSTLLRLYCIIGSSGVLLSIVPSGRRPILLALVVLVLGYSLSGGLGRRSLMQKAAYGAIIIALGFVVSAYFFAIRLAVWELGSSSSFFDQLSLALQFVTSPALEGRFNAQLYDNLRERTFMLGYLADLVEATRNSGPLFGEALLFYLRLSIPSALDPSKVDVLAIQEIEAFAHPKLGLPVIDQANSIMTDGVTDFGIAGGFIYLLGVAGMLSCTVLILRRFYKPFTFLITSMALIHVALKPEITLSEYFVTIRNLLWIVPLMLIFENIWISTFRQAGQTQPQLYDLVE